MLGGDIGMFIPYVTFNYNNNLLMIKLAELGFPWGKKLERHCICSFLGGVVDSSPADRFYRSDWIAFQCVVCCFWSGAG